MKVLMKMENAMAKESTLTRMEQVMMDNMCKITKQDMES